jgi:hypothetical protein
VGEEQPPEVDRDKQYQQHHGNDKGELNKRLATPALTMAHTVSL